MSTKQDRGKHKRADSDLGVPWLRGVQASATQTDPRKDSLPNSATPGGTFPKSRTTQQLRNNNNSGVLLHNVGTATADEPGPGPAGVQESSGFRFRGVKVRLQSTPTMLSWKPIGMRLSCCTALSALRKKLSYEEVLGAWYMPRTRITDCFCGQKYLLVVYAVARPKNGPPCSWSLAEYKLTAPSLEVAKEWVDTITAAVALCHDRPRNLLVFVNPYSGAKRARQVWEQSAMPIFQLARIKFNVVETQAQDHARDMLAAMKADELGQYQGVVAVGGDGVFQECMIGLLAQRSRGGVNAAIASRIRLGHIPGGSTDAVAFSLHGTRSVEAAVLHIALGDRLPLDVARVECDPEESPAPTAASSKIIEAADHAAVAAAGSTASLPISTNASLPGLPSVMYSNPLATPSTTTPILSAATLAAATASERTPPTSSASVTGHSKSAPASRQDGFQADQVLQAGGEGPGDRERTESGAGNAQSRVADMGPVYKHFVCQAAYGFLGDVMKFSEGIRFLGPSRYDLSGALQFLRLRSYKLHISYKRVGTTMKMDAQRVCSHRCESCRQAGIGMMQGCGQDGRPGTSPRSSRSMPCLLTPPTPVQAVLGMHNHVVPVMRASDMGGHTCGVLPPAATGPAVSKLFEGAGGEWHTEEGEYISIMAVVTPCRSDRSRAGIIPHGHLSDGRIYLVLVSKCNHLDYLRFLLRMSNHGLEDACFPFVRVIPVSALSVRPMAGAPESAWNVDGELLPTNSVRMRVARGLVDVFARGVEMEAPTL